MTRNLLAALCTLSLLASLPTLAENDAGKSGRPSDEEIGKLQTITLRFALTEKGLELNWSPANEEPSGGIKVTCSDSNKQPLYPYDGYVVWLSGTGHSSCVVPRDKAVSDKPRYYRICSVQKDNHSKYVALSDVVTVLPEAASKPAPSKSSEVAAPSQDQTPSAEPVKPAAPKQLQPAREAGPKKTTIPGSSAAPAAMPVAKAVQRPGGAIVAGHAETDVSRIPASVLDKARKDFRVWYGHTSHGSQITSGMQAMNKPPFNFSQDGANGALRYVEAGGDLGTQGDDRWAKETRRYLDNKGDANVIMWSWCGGCSGNTPDGIRRYLELMDGLEKDYPGRIFIYMTGHLDGSGKDGNLNRINESIREFCRKNGKVLFDFADIESFDPSGKAFLDLNADDGCNYRKDGRTGNWAAEWVAANPNHGYALPEGAAHTHPLNGAMKGRAFWRLLARLAGWNP